MKTCPHCSQACEDDWLYCPECGKKFRGEMPSSPSSFSISSISISEPRQSRLPSAGFFEGAQPLDLSQIDMGYSEVEGFSRPDWGRIQRCIEDSIPKEAWPQAWRELGIKWIGQLCDDLGGDYRLHESWNFLLLSSETDEDSEAMLRVAESALETIQETLGPLIDLQESYGKNVILAFQEEDDYYDYVSFYHQEGDHPRSSGVFLHKNNDYRHVALPFTGIQHAEGVLIHELVHSCLSSLNIPVWLNEGLSVRIEREMSWRSSASPFALRHSVLDRELADKHHAHWNEQNIQEFWAGIAYGQPGEAVELCYNLGEILVEVLSENRNDFLNFVQNADYLDGGQDAALKWLGKSLGDVIAGFLGPGNWRPNRKRIAEILEQPLR